MFSMSGVNKINRYIPFLIYKLHHQLLHSFSFWKMYGFKKLLNISYNNFKTIISHVKTTFKSRTSKRDSILRYFTKTTLKKKKEKKGKGKIFKNTK